MTDLQFDREKLRRLRDDFGYFAKHMLRIRTKAGKIEPFQLNQAQRYLHERLEKQRRETGKVRAIILKGRQMGCSTYLQGRFYWRMWGGKGLNAFILTHEQPATDNLFKMTKRYHDLVPDWARHETAASNAKELVFAGRECSYAVATAGTKEVGRSSTVQLLHGSEVAFWPNAEDHVAGLEQAQSDAPGTERVFESTANGIGNVYQRRYKAAERGDSTDIAIFMPWYWDDGYTATPATDWIAGKKWQEYKAVNNLTDGQLYWAFLKNRDMATATGQSDDEPCWKFKQEYPANADEAFQTAGNSFIPSNHVAMARVRSIVPQGALIIGVDPARGGGDKTGVIDRIGRKMGNHICATWDFDDLMTTAGHVVNLIKRYNPAAVNIDVGGIGAGVYDRLAELGYGDVVNAVNFGSNPIGVGPTGDELYANRRAEMWDNLRDWMGGDVQIPNIDSLHADLTAPAWGKGQTRYSSNNELVIEPKDSIRERYGFSPDLGDAAALTFAVPIAAHVMGDDYPEEQGRNATTGY